MKRRAVGDVVTRRVVTVSEDTGPAPCPRA